MKVFSNFLRQGFSALLIVVLSAGIAFAQQARGTLRGVVSDELGAAIVGATVTVTDAAGVEKTAVTNGESVYTISGLGLGKYVVKAKARGFAISDDTSVDIRAGQRQSVDLTLKVTIEEQKVTIAAE